jgi:sodium-dependent dicarboxylate transporter 2/3/5
MQWVAMVSPLVLMMLLVVGVLLGFGIRGIKIEPVLETTALTKEQKKVLAVLLGVMGLLFANAPIQPYYPGMGLSETGILLGAGLLLFAPPFGILDWMEDKDKIPFRIMMLFGAGFAIAQGFGASGLAQVVADGLTSLSTLPLVLFILVIATVVTFSTEITSNTALISIMLPVLLLISQQTQMDARLIMMVATVCSSYAFMLPIATPPNAIVMSSGTVTIKAMALYGLVLNIAGILLIVLVSRFVWKPLL